MKNTLLNSLVMGTTVIIFASASITNTFGDNHKNSRSSKKEYSYSTKSNRNKHGNYKEQKIYHKGREYIYKDNGFYRKNKGGKLVIAKAPIGAIVLSLPRIFSTVTIGNASIFFNGGIYYKKCRDGYVVVKKPHFRRPPKHAKRIIVREREYYVHNNIYYCKDGNDFTVCEPPEQTIVQNTSNDVIIMVENSNGSHTPVTISPLGGNQWKGPRGEIYNGIPGQKQLRSVYGF